MKSEINLLPPPVLRMRRRGLYQKRLNRLYQTAVVGAVIIGLTYGGVWWAMWQSSEAVRSEASQAQLYPDEEVRRRVHEVNELLREVHTRAGRQSSWVTRVSGILAAAPTDVFIETITLRNAANPTPGESVRTLVITGTTSSRSAVVTYERGLRELEWVERVEAPLQNLASAEVVNFSFTIYQKPEDI